MRCFSRWMEMTFEELVLRWQVVYCVPSNVTEKGILLVEYRYGRSTGRMIFGDNGRTSQTNALLAILTSSSSSRSSDRSNHETDSENSFSVFDGRSSRMKIPHQLMIDDMQRGILRDSYIDDEEEVSEVKSLDLRLIQLRSRDDKVGVHEDQDLRSTARSSISIVRLVCTARPSINTARPVSTARPSINTARPISTASLSISIARPVYVSRPIYPRMDNWWIVVALDDGNKRLSFRYEIQWKALWLLDIIQRSKITDLITRKGSKNHAMNELCAKKGIKSEFSVARTPQQNSVAERKNRTLIEAARTMFADSLLPIPLGRGSSGKDIGPTQEYILLLLQPHRTRILVKDVVQDAQEKPSENAFFNKYFQPSISTDRPFVSTGRSFVSTNRSNTPNVSAASTYIDASDTLSMMEYSMELMMIDEDVGEVAVSTTWINTIFC
ncbi:putative ribonuclease H-like domain-containing protein [Tanacetum coccineum]